MEWTVIVVYDQSKYKDKLKKIEKHINPNHEFIKATTIKEVYKAIQDYPNHLVKVIWNKEWLEQLYDNNNNIKNEITHLFLYSCIAYTKIWKKIITNTWATPVRFYFRKWAPTNKKIIKVIS